MRIHGDNSLGSGYNDLSNKRDVRMMKVRMFVMADTDGRDLSRCFYGSVFSDEWRGGYYGTSRCCDDETSEKRAREF